MAGKLYVRAEGVTGITVTVHSIGDGGAPHAEGAGGGPEIPLREGDRLQADLSRGGAGLGRAPAGAGGAAPSPERGRQCRRRHRGAAPPGRGRVPPHGAERHGASRPEGAEPFGGAGEGRAEAPPADADRPRRRRGAADLRPHCGRRGDDLVYTAHVSLDHATMQIEDKLVSLVPGMGVTVEIKTGSRRVIEYLLSPLLRYRQEAMRER